MADENKKPWYKDTRYLSLIVAIVAIVVTIIIWRFPPVPPDFSISIDPMLGAVQAGGVIQTTVSVEGISGYDHTVTLSATGQPSGVVTALIPPFGEAKPSYTSSVTINVDKNVPAGDYTLVFKGIGADGKEHSCSYTLTVKNFVTPTPTSTPVPKVIFSDYEVDTTIHNIGFLQLVATSVNDPPRVNDRITIEFTLQNIGDNPIKLFCTFVAARNPFGENKDFGDSNQDKTIQPQEIIKTRASIIVDNKGIWEFWPCYSLDIPEISDEENLCPSEWRRFPILVK